jgi:tRNA pseudouridine38-40 synthase
MPRYFTRLSYKGSNYHGWQIQANSHTVQSVLNEVLSTILKEKIMTTGAGRTDTGVHAPCFFAHFDCNQADMEKSSELIFKLNKILPSDIKIHRLHKAEDTWHARFSAVKRSYHYLIARKKNIYFTDYSNYIYGELSVDDMNIAARSIMKYNDFTSFARLNGGSESNICEVYESFWYTSGDYLIYKVTANRFLRNMVRAMAGTMIDVGKGKIKPDKIHEIIEARNRSNAGSSAKAKGLFLTSIVYPVEFGLKDESLEFPDFLLI